MPEPTPDPTGPSAAKAVQRIEVDDLGRFGETAGAFWMALEHLRRARAPFVGAARHVGSDLGDPRLAAQYGQVFHEMLRTLSSLERCCEEFYDGLGAVGRTYEQADDSVARHMR